MWALNAKTGDYRWLGAKGGGGGGGGGVQPRVKSRHMNACAAASPLGTACEEIGGRSMGMQ